MGDRREIGMRHTGLIRAVAVALGTGLVVTFAAAPAGAQTSGRVLVNFDAPVTTDAWYAWGGFFSTPTIDVSASAPSVRLRFPIAGTDADPTTATLGMSLSTFPGDCVATNPASLRMDGWTLVLDPAAMAASATGACVAANPGAVFHVWVDAHGPRDHLHLSVEVGLDAASTTTDVALPTIPASGDTRTYVTSPAPAWDGGVVRLSGSGGDLLELQVRLLGTGGVLGALDPSAISDADGTWTEVDVQLPSPLPAGVTSLELQQAKRGQPVRDVSVPLHVVPGVTAQRFWSPVFGNAHFYTADANEAARVRTDPNWVYEGPSFVGLQAGSDGSCQVGSPMYRFWSPVFSSHFYTMSAAERDHLVAADRNWQYEGVAYCAYADQQSGTAPLYRFWSPVFGKHFFTADQGEADHIRAVDRNWQYEGVAAYVIPGA